MTPHPPAGRSADPSGRRSAQAGFAVMEALVATLIVLAALGMLYQVIGSGSRNAARTAQMRDALMLAQSRLASVGADIPLRPGRWSGQEDGLVWQVELTPQPGPPGLGQALLVTAHAGGQSGGRISGHAADVTLRSLRLARP